MNPESFRKNPEQKNDSSEAQLTSEAINAQEVNVQKNSSLLEEHPQIASQVKNQPGKPEEISLENKTAPSPEKSLASLMPSSEQLNLPEVRAKALGTINFHEEKTAFPAEEMPTLAALKKGPPENPDQFFFGDDQFQTSPS